MPRCTGAREGTLEGGVGPRQLCIHASQGLDRVRASGHFHKGQQVQEQERAHRIPRALRQLLSETLPVFGGGDGDLSRDTLWHTMLLSVCPSSG
jgi:hypothetical protein